MKKLLTLLLATAMCSTGIVAAANADDDQNRNVNMSVRKHYDPVTGQGNAAELQGDNQQAPVAQDNTDKKDKKDKKKDKKDKKKDKKRKKPQAMDPAQYSAQAAAEQARADSIRAARQAEIEALLNTDYSIKPMVIERIPYAWKNDTVLTPVEELQPLFNVRDMPGGEKMYLYNGTTLYFKENEAIMYFTVKDGVVQPMRFHVAFYADAPLDFTRLDFLIDGFKYSYTPDKINKGKDGTRFYFENFDDPANDRSKDILYALSHCDWCHMTFISNIGVNHRIHFDQTQLKRFREIYELYRAMGGTL